MEEKIRIGIDMGGMSIKFGMVDADHRILDKEVIPTNLEEGAESLIREMAQAVQRLLQKQGKTLKECQGIGIGSPGTVSNETGMILYSNNFYWENIPIVSLLKKYLDTELPMGIANDADAAALGETIAGAGKGHQNTILFTLGTGVGSGVILNGKIFSGSSRGGCELGHTVIVDGGLPCNCGRSGCMEVYASATALMRMAKEEIERHGQSSMATKEDVKRGNIHGKIIFDAEKNGDPAAKDAVARYEHYLAVGIANAINIFRPELVMLGGGVANQGAYLTAALQKEVDALCFGGAHGEIARIVSAKLGNDAGIVGAANLIG